MSKRIKTVFPSNMVAHIFAQQSQEEGRRSDGRLYWEGPTIFSYGNHFPIASFYKTKDKTILLFTTRHYSNSTSKHINYVRAATSHIETLYMNQVPYGYELQTLGKTSTIHVRNINEWISRARNIWDKLLNARKPEIYYLQLKGIYTEMEPYLKLFKLKLTKEQKAYFQFNKEDETQYLERISTAVARDREAKLKREAKLLKQAQEKIALWKQSKYIDSKGQVADEHKNAGLNFPRVVTSTFLRVSIDKSMIQTSKGVDVSIKSAKRFYQWLIKIADEGCSNCSKSIETSVGATWDVEKVTKKFFKIGCHTIDMSEVKEIANQLKWDFPKNL